MSESGQNIFLLFFFCQVLINAADRNEVSARKKEKQALEEKPKGKTGTLLIESANKFYLAHALRALAKNTNKAQINKILDSLSA